MRCLPERPRHKKGSAPKRIRLQGGTFLQVKISVKLGGTEDLAQFRALRPLAGDEITDQFLGEDVAGAQAASLLQRSCGNAAGE